MEYAVDTMEYTVEYMVEYTMEYPVKYPIEYLVESMVEYIDNRYGGNIHREGTHTLWSGFYI